MPSQLPGNQSFRAPVFIPASVIAARIWLKLCMCVGRSIDYRALGTHPCRTEVFPFFWLSRQLKMSFFFFKIKTPCFLVSSDLIADRIIYNYLSEQ